MNVKCRYCDYTVEMDERPKNPACGYCISVMQKESARKWRERHDARIPAAA